MYVPGVDEQALAQDCIMHELDQTIKSMEKENFELFKANTRKLSKVDYTWLITIPCKHYKIPPMTRMEIETLGYKIKPEDITYCLRLFKSQVSITTPIPQIPITLAQILRQVTTEYDIVRYSDASKCKWYQKLWAGQKLRQGRTFSK